MGLEKGAEGTERYGAVADKGLRVAGFGEGSAVRRIEEDRVVAKAAGSLRFRRNAALDGPPGFEQHATVADEGERAYEPGRAVAIVFGA
jgi:hypothetical protein